jgi:tetratricopeptide (TPR) repeat protein
MIQLARTVTLTTENPNAQQLFDDAISQYIGWFGNPPESLEKAIAEDSQTVMPHVVLLAFDLLGTGIPLDSTIITDRVNTIDAIIQQRTHSKQEIDHVNALKTWVAGNYVKAAEIWETILRSHVEDTLALKFAHDSYFYFGNSNEIFNSVDRVIKYYDKSGLGEQDAFSVQDEQTRKDLFSLGYVSGMYAFGLEETRKYREAEQTGLRALKINKKDAWALHAVVHVMEMEGRQEEGIKFIKDREQDWKEAISLACHNYWHLALYHIERGEFSEAISIYDRETNERIKSGAILDLVDGSSLLYRLHMEGQVDRSDGRWQGIQSLWKSHIHDHILVFNDVHIAMTYDVKSEDFAEFIKSWDKYVQQELGPDHSNHVVANKVGDAIVRAVQYFGEEKYEDVVEMLLPLYTLGTISAIGGSHAQRDVVNQLLLNAAVRGGTVKEAAEGLLIMRKNVKPNSGVTDRLLNRL